MRKDMGKVITEKPRHGSGNKNVKTRMSIPWKGHDADYEIDKRQSSSRHRIHGYDAKSFTDVLGPLYRYLDKQVGRPWNKVNAELCEYLDKRKLTHAHVFSHIDFYVERDVYKGVDGLWHSRPYGALIGGSFGHSGSGLYVNPKTGLICRQTVKAEKTERDRDHIKISDRMEYRRIDGIWYRVRFDMVLVDHVEFDRVTKTYKGFQREELKQVEKKQLSGKELKELGLENLKCICDNKRFDPKCPRHKKEDENSYKYRGIK